MTNTKSHTTHGDIFPIHGAKMTPINGRGGSRAFPTESRSKPSPEWNHYRIECRDGEISLAVNGKVVTRGKECSPRKGYICIESEGGIVHYRNMKIKELPDTPIDKKHVAIANRNFRSLYNGIDLKNWNVDKDWNPNDWVLKYSGKEKSNLTTKESFGDIGFVFDIRLKDTSKAPVISIRGATYRIDTEDKNIADKISKSWNRFEGTLKGDLLTLSLNGKQIVDSAKMQCEKSGPIKLACTSPTDFANIYVRELNK